MSTVPASARAAEPQREGSRRGPGGGGSAPDLRRMAARADNQAMQRLLATGLVRAKLAIGRPDDPAERAADAAASRAVRGLSACACSTSAGPPCVSCGGAAHDVRRKPAARALASVAIPAPLSLGAGRALGGSDRAHFERSFGSELHTVRIHDDATAARAAAGIGARAFTLGDSIGFAAGEYQPHSGDGRLLLAHELAHVVQQRGDAGETPVIRRQPAPTGRTAGADMELIAQFLQEDAARRGGPLPFGHTVDVGRELRRQTSAWPRPGETWPGARTATGGRSQCPGGACHQVEEGFRRAAAERRRQAQEQETHERWEGFHVEQHAQALDEQARTLREDIESSELGLARTRVMLFDRALAIPSTGPELRFPRPRVSQEMREAWIAAQQATFVLQPALDRPAVELPPALTGPTRVAYSGFYTALGTVLRSRDDEDRRQAEFEARFRGDRCPGGCHQPNLPSPRTGGSFASLFEPRPAPSPFQAGWSQLTPLVAEPPPPPGAREQRLATAVEHAETAFTPEAWREAVGDFRWATNQMDSVLLEQAGAGGANEDLIAQFHYTRELLERQQEFYGAHPDAVKIQAIFYPEYDVTYAPTAEGNTCEAVAARGIPWQFYLTHTPVEDPRNLPAGFEWQLHDITAPKRPDGRTVKTRYQADRWSALVMQRAWQLNVASTGDPFQSIADIDPPPSLFTELDHSDFFPRGMLYFRYPSGKPGEQRMTEPWTLGNWLTAIGMTIAILGSLVFAPFSVPALIAVGVGTALSVAGRVHRLLEQEEHGVLTEGDLERFYWDLALDIVSALTLGFGKVVQVTSEAGNLLRAASLARSWFMLRRAQLVMNVVNIGVIAHDIAGQYRAIQDSSMSPEEKDAALARLTLFAAGAGLLAVVPVYLEARDLQRGSSLFLDVDPQNPRRLVGRTEPDPDVAGHVGGRQRSAEPIGRPVRVRGLDGDHTLELHSDGGVTRCSDGPACPHIVTSVVNRIDNLRDRIAAGSEAAQEAQALLNRARQLREFAEGLAAEGGTALTAQRAAIMARAQALEQDMNTFERNVIRATAAGPPATRLDPTTGATSVGRRGYRSTGHSDPVIQRLRGSAGRTEPGAPPSPEFLREAARAQVGLQPLPGEEGRALALTQADVRPGVIRRTQTISGQTAETPRPVVRPDLNRILAHVDELETLGHLSPGNAARMRMSGGTQLAVHAEVQASIVHPNQPIVVNREMCPSCWEYFQAEAKFWGLPQTVADPRYVRIFHPNGTIAQYTVSGEFVGAFGILR